jgi:hypothetical protein
MCSSASRSKRLSAATNTLGLAAGTRSVYNRLFVSDSLSFICIATFELRPAMARSGVRILRVLAPIESSRTILILLT